MKNKTIIFLLLFFYSESFSQISVSPVLIHLSDDKNSGSFTVYNTSADTIECLTNNNFGYPVSDDSGNVYVKMLDTIPDIEPSAKEWIKLYPKNFFIYPYSSQVVRILAKPPDNLQNGEYWSRPSITAKKKEIVDNKTADNKTLTTSIGSEIKLYLVINYRKKPVYTNVIADLMYYHFDGDKLIFLVDLERAGNAAFLGRLGIKLSDENETFYENYNDIAVYHKLKKRIEIPKDKIKANSFKADIIIDSERDDSGAEILRINPIIIRKQISINY
jgi:hypothetical protein